MIKITNKKDYTLGRIGHGSEKWLKNATKIQITTTNNQKINLAGDYNKIKNYLLQIKDQIKHFDVITNINLNYSYVI